MARPVAPDFRKEEAVPGEDHAMDSVREARPPAENDREHKRGLTEGDDKMEAIPINNIPLVFSAISLVLFLAALDQTIIATALPSIASDLHADPSQYSWVGTSYLLAATAFTPLWGRVSDIIGRKPILYGGIVIFTLSSALCGAAKTINWLIACRAIQGIGGGAIMSLTTIVISDIIPLSERGHYNGALGATWGIAAVLGPLLGGLLTDKASWRWCFYINLPTCGAAFIFLVFTLKLNPAKTNTFKQLKATFDFIGLALIMSAGSLLVVGFSMASDHGFGYKTAIILIALGGALLVASIAHFLTTSRNAIIPARALRTRTTTLFLLGSVLHATAFISSNFYVPVYLQGVRGADALHSGIQLLPYSILVAVFTIVAGQVITRLRIVRPVAWFGYALSGLGFGLWYQFLAYDYSVAVQEGIMTIAAIGLGLSLQTPVIVIQAAMPLKDMAASTSAFILARSIGGTLGISIFGAALNAELRKRLSLIEGFGTAFNIPVTAQDYRAIHSLPDEVMRNQVIKAFSDSASIIWITYCGLLLGALIITIPTRSYSMNRAPPTKSDFPPDPLSVSDASPPSDIENQSTEKMGPR